MYGLLCLLLLALLSPLVIIVIGACWMMAGPIPTCLMILTALFLGLGKHQR